jgi:hypothetical protein
MSRFTAEDLHGETAQRLQVIINNKLGKHPLMPFRETPSKSKFNRVLNEYINALGTDWRDTIKNDFQVIFDEEIMNEEFNPASLSVQTTFTKNVLLTPEQANGVYKDEPAFKELIVSIVEK